MIFLYSNPNDPLVEFADQRQVPFLILERQLHLFVSLVDNDNIKAAFDATDYFIQQNYRKIAFIGGNKELFVSQDRYEGYKEASKKAGIPLDEKLVHFSFWFYVGRQFLSNDGEPSPSRVRCHHDNRYSLLLKGAPIPIRTPADNPDYFL